MYSDYKEQKKEEIEEIKSRNEELDELFQENSSYKLYEALYQFTEEILDKRHTIQNQEWTNHTLNEEYIISYYISESNGDVTLTIEDQETIELCSIVVKRGELCGANTHIIRKTRLVACDLRDTELVQKIIRNMIKISKKIEQKGIGFFRKNPLSVLRKSALSDIVGK